MDTLEPVSPAREFTMSGSSGSVQIMSNGDYLVAEHNSGEFDIWDLSDDSLVGTYSSTGTPFGASYAFGKNNTLWIVTTTGGNGTAYCIDLTTAALLAGFTPLGLNFAQGANVVGFADDYGYYVVNDVTADDVESIDYTGAQIYTTTGTGSGTTIEAITGDGNGYIYLINGAYIQKLDVSLQTAADGNLERLHLVSQFASNVRLVCDGRYVWNASDDDRIAIFDTRQLERVSLRDVTGQAGDLVLTDMVGRVEVDGMDLIYYYDDGGGNEGWRKVRGPNLSRRFQRRPGAWTGQSPLFNVLTPMER
jgi:WD40 repeat protein